MIKSFVKDNHAYLKCLECGQEQIMLHYELTYRNDLPIFNIEKSIEQIQAFYTKHSLCKNINNQIKIEL